MKILQYGMIFVLVVLVVYLFLKLYRIKRQLFHINTQLQMPDIQTVSIEFVDKSVEQLALHINQLLQNARELQSESRKNEKWMRTSVSMISHDMRTPLTAVIGYLQLAEKECNEAQTRKNIQIALERAKACSGFIHEFFELSLIEAGEYSVSMESLNLCESVCEQILALYPEFQARGIVPEFKQADGEIEVLADQLAMNRVLQNLFMNCIKYAIQSMRVFVKEENTVKLIVENRVNHPVDAEQIFERFYREEHVRKSDGKGLGLYICKRLVEEMNGHMTAAYRDDTLVITIELDKGNGCQ
ncbi:MAG: HAMP domain-containing histidine kinase [Lachnospiraceae bacterium]|nr:HAMP domain-containing histidine kinase [Lachnospiraceae bacterium]